MSQATFLLYEKIKTYNLRYYDKDGTFKPVRFVSYIWKAVDGYILACLKKELKREDREGVVDWERFDHEDDLVRTPEISQDKNLMKYEPQLLNIVNLI